jgi:tetratricopeptide (TPR) repeat protein
MRGARRPARLARGSALAVALLVGRAAMADAIPEKAKQLAERGRELHERGDYADAIAAFEEAYALAPSAGLLFDLAQAYRLAGQCDDAAWMYRRYLETDPPPDHRTLAEGQLATAAKCGHGGLRVLTILPVIEVAAPRQTDDGVPATTAIATRLRPGARDKRIAEGFAIAGGVLLVAGAAAAIDASAVTAAARNTAQLDTDFAFGLGIAGGASLATAAVCYALGWRADHDVAITPIAHGGGMAMAWKF